MEHRYVLDDFERFFEGYGLEIRGTLGGLDVYPPAAGQATPFREVVGRHAYELVARIDDELLRLDRDLAAKHWVVYAERGRETARRRLPAVPAGDAAARMLQGAFDVRYASFDGPTTIEAGSVVHAQVALENLTWRTLSSDAPAAVQASYHWWREDRVEVERDGLRSRLPRPVGPGETITLAFRVQAPERPGRYLLALDVVEEGVAWFSEGGTPPLAIPVIVKER